MKKNVLKFSNLEMELRRDRVSIYTTLNRHDKVMPGTPAPLLTSLTF